MVALIARASAAAALVLASLPSSHAERSGEPIQGHQVRGGAVADLFRELDADLDQRLDRLEVLKHDAHPSVQEVLSKLFGEADADGDGSLDAWEAEDFVGLVHGSAADAEGEEEDVLADMFRALDEDGEGKLGLEPLLRSAERDGGAELAALVQQLFAAADVDGDGALDKAEAERFMELLDEHLPESAEGERDLEEDEVEEEQEEDHAEIATLATVFRTMDADVDGRISLQEFLDSAGREGVRDRSLVQ